MTLGELLVQTQKTPGRYELKVFEYNGISAKDIPITGISINDEKGIISLSTIPINIKAVC